jgi:vacuolar-type H+-ATPase subunit B/Vma2
MSSDNSETIDPKDMKSPPHELLEYLNKLEEAKSILSKVAAKEDNENIKNRIYAHYDKAQKLAFEMIKEFAIVH